jgi:hypothetical protein
MHHASRLPNGLTGWGARPPRQATSQTCLEVGSTSQGGPDPWISLVRQRKYSAQTPQRSSRQWARHRARGSRIAIFIHTDRPRSMGVHVHCLTNGGTRHGRAENAGQARPGLGSGARGGAPAPQRRRQKHQRMQPEPPRDTEPQRPPPRSPRRPSPCPA